MSLLISFDLWSTLIKPNPLYKQHRYDTIRRLSGFPADSIMLTDVSIGNVIKQIKFDNDSVIEIYGTAPNNMHVIATLANKFGVSPANFEEFYVEYQTGAIKYLPLMYSDDTLPALRKLKELGHQLVISTNTLFNDGFTMEMIIRHLGLPESEGGPFEEDAYMISDIVGFSKPDPVMFFEGTDFHVGDNLKTDGACQDAGIQFYQINSNDKTITDFYQHILEYEALLSPQV